MAGLDEIAESLRRQRTDLEQRFDETATSREETSRLVAKIEELRVRMERNPLPPASESTK